MEEKHAGIYCYVSQLPGFRGILKQRYSDFIVNEVDVDGNVVHLNNFDLPVECFRKREKGKMLCSVNESYSSKIECFKVLAGEDDAESLRRFLGQIRSDADNAIPPLVLSPDSDKSHRTAIHKFFKENFHFLVTDTIEVSGSPSKCIRVRYSLSAQHGQTRRIKKRKKCDGNIELAGPSPFDDRGKDDWPEEVGKFLRFHLYKENKDTLEALGIMGKMLGIQQRSFGFAGTKDKRSVSTQRVTVFRKHAEKLASLNNRLIGIKVGDFCYVHDGLVLGQLLGNRFTIILRGVVSESEEIIRDAAAGLGNNGFINYFGLQRFGSGSVPTHLVGAALLRGEWKIAADLILDPREGERSLVRDAREYYKQSGDIDGALKRFPHHLVAERSILQCLKKCPGNYLQALQAIPRTLRMMYVHSYQSFLWNHAASARVQMFGIGKVVLGDLVCLGGGTFSKASINCSPRGESNINSVIIESGAVLPEEKIRHVKVVDDDDLCSGNFTFADVVLPLASLRVLYPSNDVAAVYHDVAKNDSVNLMESVHNVKEFSITSMIGGYRRLFQRPIDYEWKLLNYKDPNMPLVETDFDIISRTQKITENAGEDVCGCQLVNSEIEDGMSNAKYELDKGEKLGEVESAIDSDNCSFHLALKLRFTLPTSCYATMAIRELLKSSTSVAFQKALN